MMDTLTLLDRVAQLNDNQLRVFELLIDSNKSSSKITVSRQRNGSPYTEDEDQLIIAGRTEQGLTLPQIAEQLFTDRSVSSVKNRATVLRNQGKLPHIEDVPTDPIEAFIVKGDREFGIES